MKGWRLLLAVVIIGFCIAIAFYASRRTTSPPSTGPDTSGPGATTSAVYTVRFFDVGQGDAELIDYGTLELLIDTGPAGDNICTMLQPYVDGALDVLVITHPHADHDGSLSAIQASYTVGTIVTTATVGQSIPLGDLAFTVLSAPWGNSNTNEDSIVLGLRTSGASFLFMGDAGTHTETRMLSAGLVQHTDVLKVGHHGSLTASSTPFLQGASPEVAVYSAATGNTYGLPKPQTIAALKTVGATVLGTDVNGTVSISVHHDGYVILAERSTP